MSPSFLKTGSLPNIEGLLLVVSIERVDAAAALDRTRRASTPYEGKSTGADSIIFMDEPTLTMEGGEAAEASSSALAPAKAVKRGRNSGSSGSERSSLLTEDESSTTSAGSKQRRKRGRPRTTNIIDVIRAREREREEEKKREREEWEERRMANPNLVIPPAANLPGLEDVMEELENQPTSNVTFDAGGADDREGGHDFEKLDRDIRQVVEDGGP